MPFTEVPLRLPRSTTLQPSAPWLSSACTAEIDGCRITRLAPLDASRPITVPAATLCGNPHASTRLAVGGATDETICSEITPGLAIPTPCPVHRTPIEAGSRH